MGQRNRNFLSRDYHDTRVGFGFQNEFLLFLKSNFYSSIYSIRNIKAYTSLAKLLVILVKEESSEKI